MNFNPELPPETGNQKPETVLTEHESLFDRLRRKWAQTAPASKYSCDSEKLYEEYLKEKDAAGVPDTLPEDPARTRPRQLQPSHRKPKTPNSNSELRTQNLLKLPSPRLPKTWEPLNPFTHPKEYFFALEHGYRIENTPKHIPDRRWEEDFGNPQKIQRHLLMNVLYPFTEPAILFPLSTFHFPLFTFHFCTSRYGKIT